MMAVATRMVMRDPLIGARRNLILVPVEVTGSFRRDRDAIEPLRRVRSPARPKHEDKHHSAKKRSPTVHHRRP